MLAAQLIPDAPPLMRISCDRYHAMIAAGSLTPDDRVELIDGYLVTKMSIRPQHGGTVNRLSRLLIQRLGDNAIIAVQNPIPIHDYSEPEPDIVVAKWRDDFYAAQHPQPSEVHLVIEVADSSLTFDRNAKVPLYAAAGIPEVWLVDLNSRQVISFRRPEGVSYAEATVFEGENSMSPLAFRAVSIKVTEIGL